MRFNEDIVRFLDILDKLDLSGYRIPGLIMSSPGVGKTSTIEKFCEKRQYEFESLIPSLYGADDILGINSKISDTEMRRLLPEWFTSLRDKAKKSKRVLLFVDELSTCDSYLQGPLLGLFFSRRLGNTELPSNVFVVAAGNYSDELNGAYDFLAPTVNRFLILNLNEPSMFDMKELIMSSGNFKLDLNEIINDTKLEFPKYDCNRVAGYILKHINFGKSEIKNSRDSGLLGFTSVRSMSYCLKFIIKYLQYYNDDLWIKILGDTLGVDENGLPYYQSLTKARVLFLTDSLYKNYKTLTDMIKGYVKSPNDTLLSEIKVRCKDVKALSLEEIENLKNAGSVRPELVKIYDDVMTELRK